MLTVRMINTTEAFFSMQRDWEKLLSSAASPNVFLTFDWQSTWWRHYGNGAKPCILAAYEGNELVGLAPLMSRQRRVAGVPAFHQIDFIGTGVSDRLDFLLSRGKELQALDAIFSYLMGAKWDVLDLQEIPEESTSIKRMPEIARSFNVRTEVEMQSVCPVTMLESDPEIFFGALGKNLRRNMARYGKRLRKEHVVVVDFLHDASALDENMLGFLQLYKKAIVNKPGTDAVAGDRFAAFRRDVVRRLAEQDRAMLAIMRVDDTLAAAWLCFLINNKCYTYNTCYDPERKFQSIGMLLMGETIRYLIDRGYHACDFLRGDEEYKSHWGSKPQQQFRVRITRKSPKMLLLETGRRLVRVCRTRVE